MNIIDYVNESKRTETKKMYMENVSISLLHGVMGICTEAAELLDATTPINVKEELGDIMWYMAVIIRVAKFNPVTLQNDAVNANINSDWLKRYADWPVGAISIISGDLLGLIKKVLFHGTPMSQVWLKLYTNVTLIYASVIAVSVENNWDLGNILDENIEKLRKRYPQKYTDKKI